MLRQRAAWLQAQAPQRRQVRQERLPAPGAEQVQAKVRPRALCYPSSAQQLPVESSPAPSLPVRSRPVLQVQVRGQSLVAQQPTAQDVLLARGPQPVAQLLAPEPSLVALPPARALARLPVAQSPEPVL